MTRRSAGELAIRRAAPADARRVASIVRAGMPEAVLSRTIYGARGFELYLRDCFALAAAHCPSRYFVAARRRRVVAFAEVRRSGAEAFLNNIYVDPAERGGGVGRQLLKEALAADIDASTLALDVFTTSETAFRWYESLGLKIVQSHAWAAMRLPAAGANAQWTILGLPQADVVHRRYGFSQVSLATHHGVFPVGRIGDGVLRPDPSLLADDDAVSALAALGAGRYVFTIVDTSQHASPRLQVPFAENRRMRGPLADAMTRLQ